MIHSYINMSLSSERCKKNNYLPHPVWVSRESSPLGNLLWFCIAEISFSGADSQYTLLKGEPEVSYVKSNLIRSMPSNDTITRTQFNVMPMDILMNTAVTQIPHNYSNIFQTDKYKAFLF